MKKTFFVIIGLLTTFLLVPLTHAQIGAMDDTSPRDQDMHWCQPGDPTSEWELYKLAYCSSIEEDDSDIIERVTEQFGVDDEDVIEKILNLEPLKPDDLPNDLKKRYDFSEFIDDRRNAALTRDVLAAYEKEKVIYRMEQSFTQQFESSEQWYNATLMDSPFDLVVDLNLIDVMLFGSQSQWNNDVYRFPSDEDEEEGEPSPSGAAGEEGAPEGGEAGPPSGGPETGASDETPFNPETDCVPADSPEAEPLAPGEIPLLCGNNVHDTGEECDDGNNVAGDGCANNCTLEGIGSLMCQDPETITFRTFQPGDGSRGGGSGSSEDGESSNAPQSCPPGSRPRQGLGGPVALTGIRLPPQNPKYPGPHIGGVLKNLPPTNQPVCPPGSTEYQIVGRLTGSTGDQGQVGFGINAGPIGQVQWNTRCLPMEFCASFDDARDFLVPGWRDDEELFKIATSIEAIVCVNLVQANRPESPYALNEGCIDCQIQAMVNELDKLLQNNVTPLENPRSGFGISNRWGPKIAFDLNTVVKGKPKVSKLAEALDEFKQANEEEKKRAQKRNQNMDPHGRKKPPDVERYEDPGLLTQEIDAFNAEQDQGYFEDLKIYRANSDAVDQSQFGGRLLPLLNQWESSFTTIKNAFMELADIKFSDLQQCR